MKVSNDVFGGKRHVVQMNVGGKDLIIGTDNIEDIARFGGLQTQPTIVQVPQVQAASAPVVREVVVPNDSSKKEMDEIRDDLRLLQKNFNSMVDIVKDIRTSVRTLREENNEIRSVINQMLEGPEGEQQPEEAAGIREPPKMEATAQGGLPPRGSPAKKTVPQSFLDISREDMQPRIWESLTREQQEQWLAKWNK